MNPRVKLIGVAGVGVSIDVGVGGVTALALVWCPYGLTIPDCFRLEYATLGADKSRMTETVSVSGVSGCRCVDTRFLTVLTQTVTFNMV